MRRLRSGLLSSAAGMPPAATPTPPPVSMAAIRFYYSETFLYLMTTHAEEIERRLIEVPLTFRETHLVPQLQGEPARARTGLWDLLRTYLDQLEARMGEIAHGHSPSFWLHLYRRINPTLSRKHASKTDNTTVALVRQIAELAYLKHGDRRIIDDLGWIGETKFNNFLGGQYKAGMTKVLGSASEARRRYEEAKAVRQSVMLRFSEADLLAAYEIEGLAYEYWRTSAAMRSLGKGVTLAWNTDESWFQDSGDGPDPLLFALFDHRIDSDRGLFTRLGTWTDFARGTANAEAIYFASYNPNGDVESYPVWDSVGQQIAYGRARLNFHVGRLPLDAYRERHAFMAVPFEKRHKVSLDAVLFCVQIAAFFAFFPDRAIFSEDANEKKTIILNNLTNLTFRGYKHIGLTIETIAPEALWWASQMRLETRLDEAQVRAGFEFLLLDDRAAALIGLWSGGKRPLLLPIHHGLLIDAAAIAPILVNLFFSVREQTGAKGFAFEDSARAMLAEAGLDIVFAGEVEFADGTKREIDAAVRIGDRLVLIECFSFEKPVDYELAKPGIFEARIERIAEKIEQAHSLATKLAVHPTGKNFDFSWAKALDWRLAVPSVEFAWEINADHFDADGVPRVLQLSELRRFLAEDVNPAEPFRTALKVRLGTST